MGKSVPGNHRLDLCLDFINRLHFRIEAGQLIFRFFHFFLIEIAVVMVGLVLHVHDLRGWAQSWAHDAEGNSPCDWGHRTMHGVGSLQFHHGIAPQVVKIQPSKPVLKLSWTSTGRKKSEMPNFGAKRARTLSLYNIVIQGRLGHTRTQTNSTCGRMWQWYISVLYHLRSSK